MNDTRRPTGPTYFLSVACHHCAQPACLAACPSGAYERRDGAVIHRDELCLGCRYCEMACPFGAPRYDGARGIMTKCDFCRTTPATGISGDQPACVAACPTEALRAAGPDDPLNADTRGAGPIHEADEIPGFADPAGCGPAIHFKLPRGVRGKRLERLRQEVSRRR